MDISLSDFSESDNINSLEEKIEYITLFDILQSPEDYANLCNPIFVCGSTDYKILDEQDICKQIYNIIIDNNFNIIYLYDYFGNLSIIDKIFFDWLYWIDKNKKFFKDIEQRLDIIEYVFINNVRIIIGVGKQRREYVCLTKQLFKYLLQIEYEKNDGCV